MVGPILYDGTGLPPTPHRRRLAPRPAGPEVPAMSGGQVLAGADLAEVNNEAIEPETVIIPAPAPTREPEPDETPSEAAQEPQEQAITESPGEPAADTATGPVSGDKSTTEDAGAATLAALGL